MLFVVRISAISTCAAATRACIYDICPVTYLQQQVLACVRAVLVVVGVGCSQCSAC
jgi:hypothetical protein